MNFIGSKDMESERLIVRHIIESDVKPLWEMLTDPKMKKYYPISKINNDWEKEKNWQLKKLKEATNPDNFGWSIVLKEENKLIGKIVMPEVPCEEITNRDLNIYIAPEYQRNGYAYETCRNVFDYMFNDVGISKITVTIPVEDEASIALVSKLGFFKERNTKTLKFPNTTKLECYIYVLTKDNFKKTIN